MPTFPDADWFLALGHLMEVEGELFRRLGYAEVRFVVRVIDEDGRAERETAVELDGYKLGRVATLHAAAAIAPERTAALEDAASHQLERAPDLDDVASFDPDFTICATRVAWNRMLDEIARDGRPEARHTLSSLALIGEELWLESTDQLREDKYFRFNQTLQELLNLSGKLSR